MVAIADEVESCARSACLSVTRLTPDEAASVRRKALNLCYGESAPVTEWPSPLWESGAFAVALQDPDGWARLEPLLGAGPCYLLFDPAEEETIYRLGATTELTTILRGTFGYEFYALNDCVTSIVGFNHHDFLLAAGDAASILGKEPGATFRGLPRAHEAGR